MIIKNANVFGKVVNIMIEDGKIKTILSALDNASDDENIIDAKGKRVIPGLVEIHAHGCIGKDTMYGDFKDMCAYLGHNGITSWYPTTMTMDINLIKRATSSPTKFPGTQILGFHLEGPYISAKYKGAQNEKYIKSPDYNEFKTIPNIKLITIAPELDGSIEFIKKVSNDCVVSLGHSDADYDITLEAIKAGANCVTHLYNAMPPFNHRNPGLIGAAFEKQIYVQLICDGHHIAKPVVLATYKMFGSQKMILISDSILPAGLKDGIYEAEGYRLIMKNGEARLDNGTIAGSTFNLWQCVKKAVEFGIPFDEAVRMATQTPSELMRLNKGKIQEGYDADLLIIDDDMNIVDVIINGEVYK